MNKSLIQEHFGEEQARGYDDRWQHTAPVRDALQLLLRNALLPLPENARILCVGAGTGAEVLYLAAAYPGWSFAAVEPSAPMLNVFRQKAEAAGIAHRCEFHEGFLESLPEGGPFDGATSILVSQFLTDPAERTEFFRQIANRLKPAGLLVSADLATPLEGAANEALYQEWVRLQSRAMVFKGIYADAPWKGQVAISKPKEVEALLSQAGFGQVVPIYQALFIHAWLAQR
jgi:tRNA (cmo5U34)-methyltransferase